jgi:hypothetical protein
MAYRITPDDVRAKLRMESTEISDAVLNSTVYIPAAEAEIDALLAAGSVTYADLDSYKQTLVDTAEILFACAAVITDPPMENFTVSVIKSDRVKGDEKIKQANALREKGYEYLLRAGVVRFLDYGGVTGGSDYEIDGNDATNLNLLDDPDDFSQFA